jgi:multidrug resistance efflux pump
MSATTSIRVPAAARWREFRIRVLPVLVLVGSITFTIALWRVASPTVSFPGQVEGSVVDVSSPKTGVLIHMPVRNLQPVQEGDPLAQVLTTQPEIAQRSLEMIQAEIQSIRANPGPVLPRQSLPDRSNALKPQSASLEDQSLSNPAWGLSDSPESPSALEAAIRAQQAKLRLTQAELAPVALRSPIGGVISTVHHRAGETITPGEPVVTIAAPAADHIVAYLRRPFMIEPVAGMKVDVRPRGLGRSAGSAAVLRVGNRLEPVPHTLRLPGSSADSDLGLPLVVSLPCDLKLIPGEIVDLTFISTPKPSSPASRTLRAPKRS